MVQEMVPSKGINRHLGQRHHISNDKIDGFSSKNDNLLSDHSSVRSAFSKNFPQKRLSMPLLSLTEFLEGIWSRWSCQFLWLRFLGNSIYREARMGGSSLCNSPPELPMSNKVGS